MASKFDKWVSENPNYENLLVEVGCKFKTKGLLITAWELGEKHWLKHKGIPLRQWPEGLSLLITYRYAIPETRDTETFIVIGGDPKLFSYIDQRSAAGKKGGAVKSKSKLRGLRQFSRIDTVTRPKRHRNGTEASDTVDAEKPITSQIWQSYNLAYLERYKYEATRNKKVNSQIKQFSERVPLEDAPHIAAFYVGHNAQKYVSSGHSVANLLYDAEKLRTEWLSGKKITSQDAKFAEGRDAMKNQLERLTGTKQHDIK